jgi:hypothetical protein
MFLKGSHFIRDYYLHSYNNINFAEILTGEKVLLRRAKEGRSVTVEDISILVYITRA